MVNHRKHNRWEAIGTAYRAGIMSLREIGTLYGVTEGAIRKKARKLEWVRKNGAQVRKKISAYHGKACHVRQ